MLIFPRFFGVKAALEPIHVQLNLHSMDVEVVNVTPTPLVQSRLRITCVRVDGSEAYPEEMVHVDAPPCSTVVVPIRGAWRGDGEVFVRFRLGRPHHGLLSRNVVLPTTTMLAGMATTDVEVSVKDAKVGSGGKCSATLTLTNRGGVVAFFLTLRLLKNPAAGAAITCGDMVLPVWWSANMVTLFPREAMDVTAEWEYEGDPTDLRFRIKGWNVGEADVRMWASNPLMI